MLTLLTQKTVIDVLNKVVAFRILLSIVDFYSRQRTNFRIKEAVLRNPLVINADEEKLFGKEARESRRSSKSLD